MDFYKFFGIIFVSLLSCCVMVPEKQVETRYVCPDGGVVTDARECQARLLEDSRQEEKPLQNASRNASQECSDDMPYVASVSGKTFHARNCSFAKRINPGNLICFKTEEEAESLGFAPCKSCMKNPAVLAP